MSNGRVAQISTPYQIYNTPHTRFVASFVGTLSMLTATVVDAHCVQIADAVWHGAASIVQPVGSTVEYLYGLNCCVK